MCMAVDGNVVNPLDQGNNPMFGNQNYHSSVLNNTREIKRQSGRHNKSNALELDEIKKCFHLPITKAAKKLNVGLTVLKKRCRELNVMRWPHRKIKSLESLIDNVKG
ncbi:hypothetical protein Leryth_027671 [Lithospermum erythrorhizon]|nr:hypothetical protein Leryth_027671 [Lithospermum erythrorhizon]